MNINIPPMEFLYLGEGQAAHLIADLHLMPEGSVEALKGWGENFCKGDHLIILGDFFEAWVENRWGFMKGYEDVLALLRSWNERGIHSHLIIGNRDVLAGSQLEKATGMALHWAPLLLDLAQRESKKSISKEHLLLLHGDELLPEDISYQRFRRFLRSGLTQSILRSLPLFLLKKLAGGARETSKKKTKGLAVDRFKPSLQGMQCWLESYPEVNSLLAGHLHRPMRWNERFGSRELLVQVMDQSVAGNLVTARWQNGVLDLESR